jgi:hypothetical protein
VTARFLVEPPATAHTLTVAWYLITTAALALTCAAMRGQWHRYTPNLRQFFPSQRDPRNGHKPAGSHTITWQLFPHCVAAIKPQLPAESVSSVR